MFPVARKFEVDEETVSGFVNAAIMAINRIKNSPKKRPQPSSVTVTSKTGCGSVV